MNNIAVRRFLVGKNCVKPTWTRVVRYLSERKKFFEEARICHSDDGFEINLDHRKLRTPYGKIIKLPNEGLAHAVAVEWNQQRDVINTNLMPLTSLCYEAAEAAEESTARSPDVLASAALKFLRTDTILFHMTEPPDLVKLQEEKWGSVLKWFCERHELSIEHTTGFGKPDLSSNCQTVLTNHLKSYNLWSLVGIEKMFNVIKSVILPLTLIDRHITVEEAVSLSRLEQEFQISKWGNVEWYHDMELLDLRMKTAACALFVQLCSEESTVRQIHERAGPH